MNPMDFGHQSELMMLRGQSLAEILAVVAALSNTSAYKPASESSTRTAATVRPGS